MITTRMEGTCGESLSEEKLASGQLNVHVQLNYIVKCTYMYMDIFSRLTLYKVCVHHMITYKCILHCTRTTKPPNQYMDTSRIDSWNHLSATDNSYTIGPTCSHVPSVLTTTYGW